MSGVFGVVSFIKEKCSMDISPMEKWNLAYGRIERGRYEDKNVKMGCCLEKLSEDAIRSAPVLEKQGKIAVIDAVLYNREELQEKCGTIEAISDEELLFDYIECFGLDALRDVNGDFAGAIYNKENCSVVLFRDHMGVRPLIYTQNGDWLAFSSDIRGLTALEEVDATISEDWIFKIVAGYSTISTEKTEFANIFCVEPSQYVVFSVSSNVVKAEKKYFWQLGSKKIRYGSELEYQNHLRELVRDAVERRLAVVSGTIGAELSGGLDSGVIDILINKAGRDGIYFSWSPSPDEVPYAEGDERLIIDDICQQENIICYYGGKESYLDDKSIMAESMREMGMKVSMEEIPALRYALPPYINALTICETAQFINRRGSKVVFTGHGGDEGISHRCNPYELFYHGEYVSFFKHFYGVTKGQPRRIIRTIKHCCNNIYEGKRRLSGVFRMEEGVPELLNVEFASKFNEKEMPGLSFGYDPKAHVLAGATCNRLYNVSILGAYCGVRYMVPFMDYRVMDFALSIPRSQYLKNGVKRYIFRETFRNIIPHSLYSLTAKQNNSSKNYKRSSNWFELFAEKKRETVEHLDRKFWEKYLNFDEIDAWLERGEPSSEDRFRESSILTCLFYCAMIENLVKKSREVGKENPEK